MLISFADKHEATSVIKTEVQQQTVVNDSKSTDHDGSDGWHLVGTFKTTTADIKHYYVVPSKINIDNYVRCLSEGTTGYRRFFVFFLSRIWLLFKFII